MASSRRSVAVGRSYLFRHFHPSFFHIVQHDREQPTVPQPLDRKPSPSPRRAPSFLPSFYGIGSQVRDTRSMGFLFPLGCDQCPRSYSTSSKSSEEIEFMNDVADVLSETSADKAMIVSSASVAPASFPGEVAAAAADSFPPVAALQHLIDAVHSFTGLNWWASIALTTVLIRGATIPLLINQLKASAKLSIMRPELEKLKEEINNDMDPDTLQENQKRMKELFKKHGVTPFTPLKGALIQGPIFISFFFAISNMVEKVPSFKGGGAYWFTDLTTPDAMYIFPVLTSLSFLATVELNMQEGMEANPMAKTMKNFSRVLALMTIPFTAGFPKAIFCYWVTSNLFSLVYGFALKRPPVRKFFNLPDVIPQSEPAPRPSFSFFGSSKTVLPTAPSAQVTGTTPVKSAGQKPSSTLISQRIRNLEKTVKARSKQKKR